MGPVAQLARAVTTHTVLVPGSKVSCVGPQPVPPTNFDQNLFRASLSRIQYLPSLFTQELNSSFCVSS